MTITEKLQKIGLELPVTSKPGGHYESFYILGYIGYVSIQFPILNGEFYYHGKSGSEISTQDGCQAMKLCALKVQSQLNSKIGFDKILGLNHIEAYYCANKKWDEAPLVVDETSDLFLHKRNNPLFR